MNIHSLTQRIRVCQTEGHYPLRVQHMSSTASSPENEDQDSSIQEPITEALALFDLTPPFSSTTLYQRYQDLLLTWHPHRYANMTNNPTKYMKMYKKGEAMTKEIRSAYTVLKEWLASQTVPSSN